ncbi:exodeoxyribonuclease V subunit beta [Thiolinea disciformis]|uniref:exodeoxyribonuclease V subunit beta n=1 Tax=Thiolinea disciformis TaxID=125614 RepID=UPI0003656E04|nr:exodeoxyribonuclease V subunit beta [Thiolinea disciformis]
MQALRPFDLPLVGKNLIQASAGTGKTWTISLLYVRLIVEQFLTVEQILVVTYTRAATEELRSRIRLRLKETLAAYLQPEVAQNEYADLLRAYPPDTQRLQYLQRALLSFDEAAVFTIHGFCQRVLQRHAFEVGLPFESELVDSDADLQLKLADQFWQQRLVKPNALDAVILRQHSITPDSLLQDVAKFIGRPYLVPIRPATLYEQEYLQAEQVCKQQLQQLIATWQSSAQSILDCLLVPDQLTKKTYSVEQCTRYWTQLGSFLSGHHVDNIVETLGKLTPEALKKGTNKKKTTPDHIFFHQIAAYLPHLEKVTQLQQASLDQLRYDFLIWLREQLPERKRQAGILAFDDLLLQVQQALQTRPPLAEQLAQAYRVALIDEFQDTDPVQFDVFESIYRDSDGQVYYVGDPKQAIYSFRGADIYTYLKAAQGVDATQQYTLARNFRSQPQLLDAFNLLYTPSQDPFRNEQRIIYETVSSGGTVIDHLHCTPPLAPLRLWDWQGNEEKTTPNQVAEQVARAIANDIARLLQESQAGRASLGNRPLSSGDFAILVRSHNQGRLMRDALQACGISSAQKSPLSIFETHEAHEIRLILAAIAEPNQIAKIRRALVTDMLGGSLDRLLVLDADPLQFDRELEDFAYWHDVWLKQGFMPMWRKLLDKRGVRKRLLAYVDGERRLTNILHLAELIHTQTRRDWRGIQNTLRWLKQQSSLNSSEEHQLRLESDENLVQIVTIHKSKGLQYPIVYCPFLWKESRSTLKSHWFAWHNAAEGHSCLQASENLLEQAKASYQQEQNSEDLRLLYVALTRAQYHCTLVVASGDMSPASYKSALNYLLYGHLPHATELLTNKHPQRQTEMQQVLRNLAKNSQGSISHDVLVDSREVLRYEPSLKQIALSCRAFKHHIPRGAKIASFSSLSAGQHDEYPDYDVVEGLELPSKTNTRQQDYKQFPAGRRAGVCLHHLLEHLDFTQPLRTQGDIIEAGLAQAGFTAAWRPCVEQLIEQTLTTPLLAEQNWCLRNIAKTDRLDELEFYFSVTHFTLSDLQQVLLAYLPADWLAIRAAVQRLKSTELEGFIKGYIDLVFRHEGRYYLVDYKSNLLGENYTDYHPEGIMQAMAEAHYYLQYLIYCVALHRYLKQRSADYTWETHVGGVFYLFLRGMHKTQAQQGIFFDKPQRGLIEALERLLTRKT